MMRGVANSITGLVSNQIALSECNLNAVWRSAVAWALSLAHAIATFVRSEVLLLLHNGDADDWSISD